MSELRFDGKVVIVTGGGGALGRSHCLLFASRGASVVVNDLGVSLSGSTDASNTSSAEKVVNEIKALGGKAIANHDDVCEGQRIIDCAINTFGRVDILINNAGNLQDKSFANMTNEMWDSVLRVHLKGAFALTKAAWPHMVKQKYGRIIMTISAAGLYGNYGQANYSTAKLALVGFMNSLSKEGANSNIYINAVAPVAGSRMTETMMPKDLVQALKPEFISPIVAYLSHDSSTTNGDIFECGAGYFAPVRFQRGPGATFSIQAPPTIEQLKSRWNDISQFPTNGEGCEYPKSAKDSIATIIGNLTNTTTSPVATDRNTTTKNSNSTPTPAPTKSSGNVNSNAATGPGVATKFNNGKDLPGEFKSETLIDILSEFLDADVVKKTKAIFVFDVTNGDKKNRKWTIDLKNGEGKISSGIVEGVKPDAIMSCSDADFVRLIYQEIHPQKLFMTGKLKVKGNLALAMKFEQVIRSLEHKAKGKL